MFLRIDSSTMIAAKRVVATFVIAKREFLPLEELSLSRLDSDADALNSCRVLSRCVPCDTTNATSSVA